MNLLLNNDQYVAPERVIDFLSKECRNRLHKNCCGKWKGLGLEIICNCKCGHNKNSQALEKAEIK